MPTIRLHDTELSRLKALKSYEYEPLGGVLSRLISFYSKSNPQDCSGYREQLVDAYQKFYGVDRKKALGLIQDDFQDEVVQ